jgi:alanyl-tRNA synthetase
MRFGEKSNFWEMGDTGPCGPCSEIHYDKGDPATQEATFADPVEGVNGANARYIEIWNNVFMQFERVKSGERLSLKNKNVDTGYVGKRLPLAPTALSHIAANNGRFTLPLLALI